MQPNSSASRTPIRRPDLGCRRQDVAAIGLSSLSGNVRSLVGLAEHLVSAAADTPPADTHAVVADFLNRNRPDRPHTEAPATQSTGSRERGEPTSEKLLAALESTDWNRNRAAERLKVSRSTFWRWLGKYPGLRQVADVSPPDLARDMEACGDDLELVAKKVGTSVAFLSARLRRRSR